MTGAQIKATLGKCDNAHSGYDDMSNVFNSNLSATGYAFTLLN
ncbi:hypothetical protein M2403_001027 [Rahnella sp. BIGb0603]|nr:hypothetical protein [Rahnella sp. BIGb0603]